VHFKLTKKRKLRQRIETEQIYRKPRDQVYLRN